MLQSTSNAQPDMSQINQGSMNGAASSEAAFEALQLSLALEQQQQASLDEFTRAATSGQSNGQGGQQPSGISQTQLLSGSRS
jgi:hypothetical protein